MLRSVFLKRILFSFFLLHVRPFVRPNTKGTAMTIVYTSTISDDRRFFPGSGHTRRRTAKINFHVQQNRKPRVTVGRVFRNTKSNAETHVIRFGREIRSLISTSYPNACVLQLECRRLDYTRRVLEIKRFVKRKTVFSFSSFGRHFKGTCATCIVYFENTDVSV